MKIDLFKAVLAPIVLISATGVMAETVYLNKDNISVTVGDGTSAGTFNNTFNGGQTIEKVIDAPTADAEEFHNQTTHIWFTADDLGGGLELDFDFGQSYDVTTLHFWNYTSESYDVDDISFQFYDSFMNLQGELSVMPELGSSPGISAQDIELIAPLNIQYVSAFLTGTNRQVDFQNMGFTATVSAVPAPATVWMFMCGIGISVWASRRKKQ